MRYQPIDTTLIDEVAVVRALNGDMTVYYAMPIHERRATWDWLYAHGDKDHFIAVANRLVTWASVAHSEARKRALSGTQTIPDLGLWEGIFRPPHVSEQKTWQKELGLRHAPNGRPYILAAEPPCLT